MVATGATSLFDMPIEEFENIEFDHVEAFLSLGLKENEKIEYKKGLDSAGVASAIGAMSNTEGGIIFLGVAENKQEKIPESLDGISTRDPIGWVTNVCYAHITPPVFLEVKPVEIPQDKHPSHESDRYIVVIRVRAGQNQPYFVREKGVLVRIADQDRPADLPTLERMFRRKIEPTAQLEHLERLLGEKDVSTGDAGMPSELTVIIGPKLNGLRIRIGTNLDHMLLDTVQRICLGHPRPRIAATEQMWLGSRASKVIFDSRLEQHKDELLLDDKATLIYRSYLRKGLDQIGGGVWFPDVELWELAREIYEILDLAERLYVECGYRGPVFVGAVLTNLNQVALKNVSYGLQIRRPLIGGWKDEFELSYEHDKIEVIRHFLQSLLRELQYRSAENIADNALITAGIGLYKAQR